MTYIRVLEITPTISQHIFDLPCVWQATKTLSGGVIYKLQNVRNTNGSDAIDTFGHRALAMDRDGNWWLLTIDEYLDTLNY